MPGKFKDLTVLFTTNLDIGILCWWGEKVLGLSTTKRKTVKKIKEKVEVYCGKHCHNLLVSHNLWVFVVCYKQKLFHYCLVNANIIILQGKKKSSYSLNLTLIQPKYTQHSDQLAFEEHKYQAKIVSHSVTFYIYSNRNKPYLHAFIIYKNLSLQNHQN